MQLLNIYFMSLLSKFFLFCFVLFRKSLKNVLHMYVFSIAGRQPGITEAYNRYEAQ